MTMTKEEMLKMAAVVQAAAETNLALEQKNAELESKVAAYEQQIRFDKLASTLIEKGMHGEESKESLISWLHKVASDEDKGELEIRAIERSAELGIMDPVGKVAEDINKPSFESGDDSKTASSLERFILGQILEVLL